MVLIILILVMKAILRIIYSKARKIELRNVHRSVKRLSIASVLAICMVVIFPISRTASFTYLELTLSIKSNSMGKAKLISNAKVPTNQVSIY